MFLPPILRYHWRRIVGAFLPLLLVPIPLLIDTQESRCGYVILLMACYWIVEPIPVAATSLLPVVLFPLFGILSTGEASQEYMNGANMMFLGGLFMAVAVEECNLHKRIALYVLRRVGTTVSWMLFGSMATSMFLSMWISNTATVALMVLIIEAVMEELGDEISNITDKSDFKRISEISIDLKPSPEDGALVITPGNKETAQEESAKRQQMIGNLKRALFLSVAYSSNIGGTGTLTGTGQNLVVKSIAEKLFPESNDLTFDKWMLYNVPVMLLCVSIAWFYLFLIHIRGVIIGKGRVKNIVYLLQAWKPMSCRSSSIYTDEMKKSFQQIIKKKHEEMGPMSFREKAVTLSFLLLVMLWIFRDPHFIHGWGNYFPVKVSDATPAIAIPALLFLIPADPWHLGRSTGLLEWKTIQQKVPWGVSILLGGGFSLAAGSEKSGLSKWLTQQLMSLNIESPLAMVALLCIMTAFITEFTSNSATANILLPVVAELGVAMKIHPLYLMIPVTISCSFAFMLPVATPPNAIVYDAGGMKTLDMMAAPE